MVGLDSTQDWTHYKVKVYIIYYVKYRLKQRHFFLLSNVLLGNRHA